MRRRYLFSVIVLLSLTHICLWAQTDTYSIKQVDSILKARVYTVYENPEESIELGLKYFENEDLPTLTRTRASMLITLGYTSKRDYRKALEHIIKAKELSKDLNNEVLKIDILFQTGMLYQQLKIYDKSIEYLEQAEQKALIYPAKDSVRKFLANSYCIKGFIYKDNLNCDIALDFFEKGIKEYDGLEGIGTKSNLSIVYYNKGNCYTLLSEYENAKTSFYKSMAYAKMENARSLIAFAQKGLAEVYTLEGNYEKAIDLLGQALEQSKNVGDLVLNSGIYGGLFENHLALNHWEEYQTYYALYNKTQLDIKISERNSISDSLEESSKILDSEIDKTKHQFSSILKGVLLVLFIGLSIIAFLVFKNKKTIAELQKKVEIVQNQKVKP